MINDYANHWIPSEGYKYISNDSVWTDSIFLGAKDSIDNWHDTNDEPPVPPEPPEPRDPEDVKLAAVIDDAETMANDLIGA